MNSEKHLRLGVGLADRGDFENARRELQLAVESWPENREALAKLREVSDTLMGDRDMEVLRLQQNHMEINNHIRRGERYYAARQYEEALREFKDAVYKIKATPCPNYRLKNMVGDLENYGRRTQTAVDEEQAAAEALKREEARAVYECRGIEQAARREILEFIAGRLELAFMLFDQRKFDRCARFCDQILLVDPHYVVARQLKDDAKRLKYKPEGYKFIAEKVRQWKLLRRQQEESTTVIPYEATFSFPSREEWARISAKADSQPPEPNSPQPRSDNNNFFDAGGPNVPK